MSPLPLMPNSFYESERYLLKEKKSQKSPTAGVQLFQCGKHKFPQQTGAFYIKAPISLAWRLVGDLMVTRVSVVPGNFAATSPGVLAGSEGVAVKSNMLDFF